MAIGKKTGGRQKGTPNVATVTIEEKLARLGCDPLGGMAQIALNKLPCGVCRGKGRTRYALPKEQQRPCKHCKSGVTFREGSSEPIPCEWCSGTGIQDIGERTCQSCYGTLFEACDPRLRGQMNAELAQYVAPKRKAIDHTNSDGTLRPKWEMIVVDSPKRKE